MFVFDADKIKDVTGKSLSEALIFASTNPTQLFLTFRAIFVHNMFCRYSELTIFINNEQSVILWVS